MHVDLRDMPGPAPYYVTVARAQNDYKSGRCNWPISGDHTTRAKAVWASIPTSGYTSIAKRENVWYRLLQYLQQNNAELGS